MRTVQRNKEVVYYALYSGVTDVVDSDGNYTGEQIVSYGDIKRARMNVSGGRGRAEIELFGVDNPFTHTLVTEDLETPFDTDTIWWVRNESPLFSPEDYDGVTTSDDYLFGTKLGPHNMRCTGVSRTINQVVIALAELDVTHGEPMPSA